MRDLIRVGYSICFACSLLILQVNRSPAGCRLDALDSYGPADLKFGREAIAIDDCEFANDGRALWLLSGRDGVVYRVSSRSEATIYINTDSLALSGGRLTGMWAGDNCLFLALSGPKPAILQYSTNTGIVRHWPQNHGVYDVASRSGRTVVVPMATKADETSKIHIYDKDLLVGTRWGERCPPEFATSEPILRLACLNRIAMTSGDRLYLASLNTGACEVLMLNEFSVAPVRAPDPQWAMPEMGRDRRLSVDTMVLDVAAGSIGDVLFVLASPKGIHGRHVLEVYSAGILVEQIPLAHAFGAVVCGSDNRIALIRDEQPARIDVFRYEIMP